MGFRSRLRRDPRSDHGVSFAFGSLTSVGTGFESWWVHDTIVDGGLTIHKSGLNKDLQKSSTKVGLFLLYLTSQQGQPESSVVKV